MKTNRSIYLVLVIALGILAWWLLRPSSEIRETTDKRPRLEPEQASDTNSFESPESAVPRDRAMKTDAKVIVFAALGGGVAEFFTLGRNGK